MHDDIVCRNNPGEASILWRLWWYGCERPRLWLWYRVMLIVSEDWFTYLYIVEAAREKTAENNNNGKWEGNSTEIYHDSCQLTLVTTSPMVKFQYSKQFRANFIFGQKLKLMFRPKIVTFGIGRLGVLAMQICFVISYLIQNRRYPVIPWKCLWCGL